jgi:hypothetical protein
MIKIVAFSLAGVGLLAGCYLLWRRSASPQDTNETVPVAADVNAIQSDLAQSQADATAAQGSFDDASAAIPQGDYASAADSLIR